MDGGQYNDARPVFWATGACLAVNMDAFERAGKLDPAVRAHGELISAGACNIAGYAVWVEPKSEVYHLGGATLNADSHEKPI